MVSRVFAKAPIGAKYMFFTAYQSDFSKIAVYEGFTHDYPISENLWTNGKTLMTLGDSLTEASIWQTIVMGRLGFSELINLAHGGTMVNVFADEVTADNIAAVDVVTIMGFYNSKFSKPGTVADEASNKPEASICAGYKYIIDKIYKLKPTVKIILITPHRNRAEDGEDKTEAIKSIADYYSIPCIDLYNNAGFNGYTYDSYLVDIVHSSSLGYMREAEVIIGGLLNFIP